MKLPFPHLLLLVLTVGVQIFSSPPQVGHREEADLTRPVNLTFEGVFDWEVRNLGPDQKLCPVLKTKSLTYRIRTYADAPWVEAIRDCKSGTPCLVKGKVSAEGDLWAEEFSIVSGIGITNELSKQKSFENCFSILRNEMSMNWFDEQLWAACLGADPDCIIKQCRANKDLYPEDFVAACGGSYDPGKQPDWDVSKLKVKSFKDLKSSKKPSPITRPAPAIPQPSHSPCQFWRAEAEGKGPIHNGSCGFFPGSGSKPWEAENMAINTCRQNAGRSPHGEVCRCTITMPARCIP